MRLAQQRLEPLFHTVGVQTVGEATDEAPHQAKASVQLSQQQQPRVLRDRATVKPGHHGLAFHRFKLEPLRVTVCPR
jgi:hypothetical protein